MGGGTRRETFGRGTNVAGGTIGDHIHRTKQSDKESAEDTKTPKPATKVGQSETRTSSLRDALVMD
jgi:hypothetical protein